jgi:hypothetical protein
MSQNPCISFHRAALFLVQHWTLSTQHSLHLQHPHLIISGAILACTVSQPPLQPLHPATSSVIDDHRVLSHLVSKTPSLHHASSATLVSYPPVIYSVLYSCHVLQASSLYFLSFVVSRSLSVLVSDSSFGRCIVHRIVGPGSPIIDVNILHNIRYALGSCRHPGLTLGCCWVALQLSWILASNAIASAGDLCQSSSRCAANNLRILQFSMYI